VDCDGQKAECAAPGIPPQPNLAGKGSNAVVEESPAYTKLSCTMLADVEREIRTLRYFVQVPFGRFQQTPVSVHVCARLCRSVHVRAV